MYGIPFKTIIILKYTGMVESDKSKHKMKGFEIEAVETKAVGRLKKRIKTPPKPVLS
jgi:hypothetical protein